jgi:hypothetical protein
MVNGMKRLEAHDTFFARCFHVRSSARASRSRSARSVRSACKPISSLVTASLSSSMECIAAVSFDSSPFCSKSARCVTAASKLTLLSTSSARSQASFPRCGNRILGTLPSNINRIRSTTRTTSASASAPRLFFRPAPAAPSAAPATASACRPAAVSTCPTASLAAGPAAGQPRTRASDTRSVRGRRRAGAGSAADSPSPVLSLLRLTRRPAVPSAGSANSVSSSSSSDRSAAGGAVAALSVEVRGRRGAREDVLDRAVDLRTRVAFDLVFLGLARITGALRAVGGCVWGAIAFDGCIVIGVNRFSVDRETRGVAPANQRAAIQNVHVTARCPDATSFARRRHSDSASVPKTRPTTRMALLVDKHRPRTLVELTYHPELTQRLSALVRASAARRRLTRPGLERRLPAHPALRPRRRRQEDAPPGAAARALRPRRRAHQDGRAHFPG